MRIFGLTIARTAPQAEREEDLLKIVTLMLDVIRDDRVDPAEVREMRRIAWHLLIKHDLDKKIHPRARMGVDPEGAPKA
jgi:hypothetical protein